MVLDLDLNHPPPVEVGMPWSFDLNFGQAGEQEISHLQVRTDSQPVDDEVVVCSPRSFAEARDRRRNRMVIEVLDEESEFRISHSESATRLSPRSNRHRRTPSKASTVNVDLCINLARDDKTKGKDIARSLELPVSESQPKTSTFSCPICMGPFDEETSTKCGHIFCKNCIRTAITAQKKCPTCRKKLKMRDTFRVYLPTT